MADPHLQRRGGGGGAGHQDPEIRGVGGTRSKKNFFRPFGPHFGLKIRRGGTGPYPGSATGHFSMTDTYCKS